MAGSVSANSVAWINGVEVEGKDLRFLNTGHLVNGSTGVDARSGVRPGVNAAVVTVPVSGMQVQVAPVVTMRTLEPGLTITVSVIPG